MEKLELHIYIIRVKDLLCLKTLRTFRQDESLRASPPIPPNANGGRACMPEAGHLAVSGPALTASGPGHPTANGTHAGLRRSALTAPASGLSSLSPAQLPPTFLSGPPPPPHSSPPSSAHQSAHTSFCWQFSFLIFRGFCYGFGLNCRVYLGGVQAVGFGEVWGYVGVF